MSALFRRASRCVPVIGLVLSSLPVAKAQPIADSPLWKTPLAAADFDQAAYTQWVDGTESPVSYKGDGWNKPTAGLWSEKPPSMWGDLLYGDAKTTGVRYLRLGWKTPVLVGSVLVKGGGTLSVLKSDAPYPGHLNDDSQWIPAQRLENGQVMRSEVGARQIAIWVLPPGTRTRALRFSHTPQPTDPIYGGSFGGAYVLEARVSNLAPFALARASISERTALLNNEQADSWDAWQNISQKEQPLERTTPVSEAQPEWTLLTWPQSVTLQGVNLLGAGFAGVQIQSYHGAGELNLAKAAETDWKTVGTSDHVEVQYPRVLTPNWIDFGQPVTTRALRVRIIKAYNDARAHPHLHGATRNGLRVTLDEIQALQWLGNAPLVAPVSAATDTPPPHPPIPVRFHLQKPGYVTLVIEDGNGKRLRNLVSETYFPAGDNVAWWDGTNDLGRDLDAARHGVYHIPAQLVAPGSYQVRGLVRDAINLSYEFSVYNAGNPAWPIADHTGAWLANHTAPQAALYVPADNSPTGQPAVLLGSPVSEGRDGLAWVDLNGRKQGGKTWIGGNWTGAAYLARDAGQGAVPQVYAYVGSAWDGVLRLTALYTNGQEKAVLKNGWQFPGATGEERKANGVLGGIAASNGVLAVSLPKQNQVLFIDAKQGAVLNSRDLLDPHGIAFDADGKVVVLSSKTLVCFERDSEAAPQTIVAAGLEAPRGLALDQDGHFLVSDGGQSHQVKLFDQAGKFVRAIGKPGSPQPGPYDPLHMNNPDGLTVDANHHLWVAENDHSPKRVSVWTLDGQLVNAFYGPSQYGGGGRLDADDPTRFYYGGMEFHLDWKQGRDRLVNVLYRPDSAPMALAKNSGPPEMPLYRKGQRYFTNAYNSNPTGGASIAYLFIEKNSVARPVAALGRALNWDILKSAAFQSKWPKGVNPNGATWDNNGKNQTLFLWNDSNGDAQVQPDEVEFRQGATGEVTVLPDLSFVVSRFNGTSLRYDPVRFDDNGVPHYDIDRGGVLMNGVEGPQSSGGDQVLVGENGLSIAVQGISPFSPFSISGALNGVPKWSYPNPWPGLHASHESAAPTFPGEVIGPTRLLGGFIQPKNSDAGQIWGVNANMGNLYLFTSDGLFIATLFEDERRGQPWAMPVAKRGMKLNGLTLHGENFWPSLTQTPDGRIYLVDGGSVSLVRVDGLESIRRLPFRALQVGAEELKQAQVWQLTAEAQRQQTLGGVAVKVVNFASAPKIDGGLDEWAGANWVNIDKSGVRAFFNSNTRPYNLSGAVALAGDHFYAAWRTADADLLKNSGEVPLAPFKTGGALDLMIGTNPAADPTRTNPVTGDVRLLVTQVKGQTRALLYRAVVPGTAVPIPFSSPWRTISFDEVEDVSDQVKLAGTNGNYEISIPLATLGLKPQAGQTIKGDIGILRGDGAQTVARTYWANKATAIVSDVPSEAALTPNLWGDWTFE